MRTFSSCKKIAGLVSLVICLCLLFTSCSVFNLEDFAFPWEEEIDYKAAAGGRRTIPYEDMKYERPDVQALKTKMTELTAGISNATSFEELLKLDEESGDVVEQFSAMRTLAELKKYHDVNDTYYEEEYRYLAEHGVEISNLINDLNRVIIEGPYAAEYQKHHGDFLYQSMVDALRLTSKEVEPYQKERAQLNTDYNKLLSTLTIGYDGKEYTLAELDTLKDERLYYRLYNQFFADNADRFTEMYANMLALDKRTAATLGFDSAADMYYLGYARDYTPEQSLALCESVKEIFVPLVPGVLEYQSKPSKSSLKSTLAAMPQVLENVDEELAQAWNHMMVFGLYDYEAKAGKQTSVAFTTNISLYDAPFCYGYWEDNERAVMTVMHEFGHYYDNWYYYDKDIASSLDIAEVYSQGLELLLHEYMGEFVKNPDDARLRSLQSFMQAITYQALYEEFQLRLYEMESFTAHEVGQLYTQLLDEYGYGNYTWANEDGVDNTWYAMTHIFDAPFYTISYTTSALVALQIWAKSQENWRAGADTYLDLLHVEQNQPFTQLIESAGLRSFADETMLSEVASYFVESFDLAQGMGEAA